METVTFKLSGLHCGHCVKNVEGAVSKLDGVSEINVFLDSQTAVVNLDQEKISDVDIQKTIEGEGYGFQGRSKEE